MLIIINKATAAELDKQFSDSGKSSDGLGQLHGIPISLKESIDVKVRMSLR